MQCANRLSIRLLRIQKLYDEISQSDRLVQILTGQAKLTNNNQKLRMNFKYNRMRISETIALCEDAIAHSEELQATPGSGLKL